jgi:hypothetical protein
MQSCVWAFRIIEKCVASDQIVIDAVISKSGTDSGRPPVQDPKSESSGPQLRRGIWQPG